jgi:PIN domain nuclease of toxin-antitoxin system
MLYSKKQKKEQQLMELVNNGEITYDEVEKYRTLYEARKSQLGLSEHCRACVCVCVLFSR